MIPGSTPSGMRAVVEATTYTEPPSKVAYSYSNRQSLTAPPTSKYREPPKSPLFFVKFESKRLKNRPPQYIAPPLPS